MPLGKSASSRGGGRGRSGGAESVEQSGTALTMDRVVRLSTAATQTELSMDALAKLEEDQAELKVENRRLKRNAFERKRYKDTRKQKLLERKLQLKLAAPKLPGLAHEDRVDLEKNAQTSTPQRRRRLSADVAE